MKTPIQYILVAVPFHADAGYLVLVGLQLLLLPPRHGNIPVGPPLRALPDGQALQQCRFVRLLANLHLHCGLAPRKHLKAKVKPAVKQETVTSRHNRCPPKTYGMVAR
jgi:hypothetical protein